MADRDGSNVPLWPALVSNAAVALTFMLIPALVPDIVADYGVALSAGGWILTVMNIPFIAAGWWLGRRGSPGRRALLVGLAIQALANAVAPVAATYVFYLVTRLLVGLGMALSFVGALTMVGSGRNVPRRSAVNAAALPATAALVPAGGWLIDELGWEATHLVLAAIAAAVWAVLMTRAWPEPPYAPRLSGSFGFSRPAWIGYVSVLFWSAALGGLQVFVGGYADVRLPAVGNVATLTAFGIAAGGVAGFAGASMASRFPPRLRPYAGLGALLTSAAVVLWFVRTGSPATYLAALAAWGFANWVVYSVYHGMLAESVDAAAAGRALTFYQFPYSVGLGLGPVVGGVILADTEFGRLGWFAAAAMVVAAVVFGVAWRDRLRPERSHPGG